jgi:hypothetical protein
VECEAEAKEYGKSLMMRKVLLKPRERGERASSKKQYVQDFLQDQG